MGASLPIVLVPGVRCSARLFSPQIPAPWRFGPVTVFDHTRGDTVGEIARLILDTSPPRFALVGLSLGGYIAFEMLRQAQEGWLTYRPNSLTIQRTARRFPDCGDGGNPNPRPLP